MKLMWDSTSFIGDSKPNNIMDVCEHTLHS